MTLERDAFASAHSPRSTTLSHRVIQTSGDSAYSRHALVVALTVVARDVVLSAPEDDRHPLPYLDLKPLLRPGGRGQGSRSDAAGAWP
jgi:hypothetical protein